MNDKDKEAFEKWFNSDLPELPKIHDAYEQHIWRAACEYKQAEIDEVIINVNNVILQTLNLSREIDKLQVENSKLIQCLKQIANEDYRGNRSSGSVKAYLCLKELDEK